MTRRIALAILLTVWATLIAGGATAYLTTRAVLLADLDASLVERAMSLPQVNDEKGRAYQPLSDGRMENRYVVQDRLGRTLARPTTAPAMVMPEVIRTAFATLSDGSRVRTMTLRAPARPLAGGQAAPVTISISASAEHLDALLNELAYSIAAQGIFGGILAAAIAYWVAKKSLRPLHETAAVVGSIDERFLFRRIGEDRLPPELLPVARRLNEMLGRLEESIRQRQQFIADASHELRTPVAALVTALEVSLRRVRDADSYRNTMTTCLTDARLLQRLVEALLDQARCGLAPPRHASQEVEPSALIEQCVAALSPLAEQRSIRIEVQNQIDRIRTEPDRLRSILLNLLGNAIEYSRPATAVKISLGRDNGHVVLSISDAGPGIAPQHLRQLFQPLFRADTARSSGHLGLGLYLVRTHARALGGDCTVRSELGSGTTFEVRLPVIFEPETTQPKEALHMVGSR